MLLHTALAAMLWSAVPGQTVMLEFTAPWCSSCRAMEPTVRDLEKLGYPIRRLDLDQQRALAAQFHVEKIPCFIMLVDGREVDRHVGGTSFSHLQHMCKLGAAASQAGPRAAAFGALRRCRCKPRRWRRPRK